MNLTKKQREVYDAIEAFIETMGYAPSYAEIGEVCSLSSLATVHKHVNNLRRKGWVEKVFNRKRSIELTKPSTMPRLSDKLRCPNCKHDFTVKQRA